LKAPIQWLSDFSEQTVNPIRGIESTFSQNYTKGSDQMNPIRGIESLHVETFRLISLPFEPNKGNWKYWTTFDICHLISIEPNKGNWKGNHLSTSEPHNSIMNPIRGIERWFNANFRFDFSRLNPIRGIESFSPPSNSSSSMLNEPNKGNWKVD